MHAWDAATPVSIAMALLFGYLCGSIPFGLLLTRASGMGDVRSIGSGNIGATNVLRTGRKDLAAATLLLDALKGTVAVLIARWFAGGDCGLAAGVGAFLGHIFPAWLGFRGGKGVATFLGVLIGLAWPVAITFALVWLAVAAATRYSSGAALAASVASPVAMAFFAPGRVVFCTAAMVALLWWTHRENIRRLLAGQESRIGGKA